MNGINLMNLVIQIIIGIIIVTPVLWLVGRSMVGKEKAKFTDAIWIGALGIIIATILGTLVHGLLGFIITLIVWLALIRHFFDTGWMKALLLAILLVIVLFIVVLILAVLGIAMLAGFGAITGIFEFGYF
ncbi:MAG: hypothetical protein WBF08_09835 [Candidatus Bathyarchaeia archaeon]